MEHLLSRFGQTYKERIARAVLDITSGKGVLVVDNENRENEGDLIFSAEKMTVKDMALTIRECSGIVCLCITAEHAAKLNLQYMVADNSSKYQTPFTVTIEAKKGVTTGVSAADRIQTIKTAIADGVVPADLARPGHVFPLIANANGVLGREGHTEGSIDLMKIAGLKPAAVLCELTNEDGTMAKLPELISFAEKHEIIVISIEDIICYRKSHE